MLINISGERKSIQTQFDLLNRLRYKLASQMRGMKEYTQLKMIIKRTNALLKQVEKEVQKKEVREIDSIDVKCILINCKSVQERIQTQGFRLQKFIADGFLLPFATIAYGICAKVHSNVEKIGKKLEVINKIQD